MKNKELIKESKKGSKNSPVNEPENADEGKSKKESTKDGKEQRDAKSLRAKFQLRKEKNPELKFEGEGVTFKAKLIGIEKVDDARGDKMCQESLQRLKAAVKLAGEHKQKILLGISLDGVKIKDEKSGELMYHHQVHKISFISQDVGDTRAFGYVFGAPHSGHQFFAIKTEKSASNVVIALRDLFQTVLQMKKQEMEKVRQQQDNSTPVSKEKEQIIRSNTCESAMNDENGIQEEPVYSDILSPTEEYTGGLGKFPHSSLSSDSREMNTVDSILDFQFEVDCLQQGIAQMDNSIAKAAAINSSFDLELPFPPLSTPFVATQASCQKDISTSELAVGASPSQSIASISDFRDSNMDEDVPSNVTPELEKPKDIQVEDRYAVFSDLDSLPSIFENPYIVEMPTVNDTCKAETDLLKDGNSDSENTLSDTPSRPPSRSPNLFDTSVFADLDPLGKNRPYVDKKDFFQDLKKPKKVLKDLAGEGSEDNLFDHDLLQSPHSSVSDLSVGVASVHSGNGNPFKSETECPSPSPSPSKLLPKQASVTSNLENQTNYEKLPVEISNSPSRNPFNPFISNSTIDIPPPTVPPPCIPARGSEPLFQTVPSPPPRPPSRNCTTPTPPLPKRKLPQSQYGQVSKNYEEMWNGRENCNTNGDVFAPPIPIPARKPPLPYRCGSPLLANSPASIRRQLLRSSASIDTDSPVTFSRNSRNLGFNGAQSEEPNNSPKFLYSKNISPQCSTSSSPSKTRNPFETAKLPDSVNGAFPTQLSSPPLPARPPKSPIKTATSVRSSNGCETDSKKTETTHTETDISIFQRKHDPFDDEFFTSLPRKSNQKDCYETTRSASESDANSNSTKG
ncbi:protein disabled-like [Centruroides vittatus]|uniref:protein disabled-like n=1 Tax=Centruroides vittatus TaxID=120091 RepID=UPI00350EAC7B